MLHELAHVAASRVKETEASLDTEILCVQFKLPLISEGRCKCILLRPVRVSPGQC